ncbi:ABC transporter ATP-binding protein [Vagococcus sp.]|uniref:ABC transporter ATP-binding protein n=1 Tax=Vagococcus sp. TaxID=1933889 RepID=UPI002FC6490D
MIVVTAIEKNYGLKHVLKGINFEVKKGEIYVLLGKNGAGKSTLFKILSGLTHPTTGCVTLFQHPLSDLTKQKIGVSINQPVFYEHLSATENLSIHCDYMSYPLTKERLTTVLDLVGLQLENETPVKNYSLGMRQRLVIARCLIHEPELLIIDEPLNGLDPKGIRQIRELIQTIAASGITILMSSHILSEVQAVATKIGVIYNGQLVFEGFKSDLVTHYGTKLEDFLINKMEGELNETY